MGRPGVCGRANRRWQKVWFQAQLSVETLQQIEPPIGFPTRNGFLVWVRRGLSGGQSYAPCCRIEATCRRDSFVFKIKLRPHC